MKKCYGCDNLLSGRKTKWCSRECQDVNYEAPMKIRICEECKETFRYREYSGSRAKFCSRTCLGKVNARNNNAHHLENRIELTCRQCKKKYKKAPSVAPRSKYCSRTCQNTYYAQHQGEGKRHRHYKNGIGYYRQTAFAFYGSKCKVCNMKEAAHVHHKDANRSNNDIRNLVPICTGCHTALHGLANRGVRFAESVESCPTPEYYDTYILPLIQGITKKRKEKRESNERKLASGNLIIPS